MSPAFLAKATVHEERLTKYDMEKDARCEKKPAHWSQVKIKIQADFRPISQFAGALDSSMTRRSLLDSLQLPFIPWATFLLVFPFPIKGLFGSSLSLPLCLFLLSSHLRPIFFLFLAPFLDVPRWLPRRRALSLMIAVT